MKACRLARLVALETWKANIKLMVLLEKAYWLRKAVLVFMEEAERDLEEDIGALSRLMASSYQGVQIITLTRKTRWCRAAGCDGGDAG